MKLLIQWEAGEGLEERIWQQYRQALTAMWTDRLEILEGKLWGTVATLTYELSTEMLR